MHVDRGRIVLLRHGETEWSKSGRHTGVTDLPLTEEGEAEARAAGHALARRTFGLVLVSPRVRARTTVALAGFGDDAAITPDLAEWDYGTDEGRTTDEILAERPDWDLWEDGGPGGESPEEIRARVTRVIDRVAPVVNAGQDVLLVAHGHVSRVFAVAWLRQSMDFGSRLALGTAARCELGFEHSHRAILHWNLPPTMR